MKKKARSSYNRLELMQGMVYISNTFVARVDSKKTCNGCKLRQLSENCQYRIFPKESARGYRYRMYNEFGRKIKKPICKHPDMSQKYKPLVSKWAKVQGYNL